MNDEKQLKDIDGAGVNLGGHQSQCHVCVVRPRFDVEGTGNACNRRPPDSTNLLLRFDPQSLGPQRGDEKLLNLKNEIDRRWRAEGPAAPPAGKQEARSQKQEAILGHNVLR